MLVQETEAEIQQTGNARLVVSIIMNEHEGHGKQLIRMSRDMAACLAESLVDMLKETGAEHSGEYVIECGI